MFRVWSVVPVRHRLVAIASVWVDRVATEVEVEVVEDYRLSLAVTRVEVEGPNRLEVRLVGVEGDSTTCRTFFDWAHFVVAHPNLEAAHFEADSY